jgi:CHAP domain
MTEWWEVPYKGGPMVAVPGFPRPLYPPDAKGKTPSVDGPDVLAYKRTVSRAQRWQPWEPASWDDSFNNGFSHGRGTGNVGDSGIAGIQRQQNLDDTGWVGEQTFNTLRSIRVPTGPNAGQMAMDANAQNLIAEAFGMFAGKAPALPSTKTTRERALEGALSWLGYKESPAGSNDSHFGRWYGMNYQPWCAMAVTHWFEIEGGGSKSFAKGAAYSYCPYILHDAQVGKGGLSVTKSPIPGDVVLFDWNYDGAPDHVGIFEEGSASSFTSIEGNTSTSNNSNGGEVMRRSRRSSDAKITFVRVAE